MSAFRLFLVLLIFFNRIPVSQAADSAKLSGVLHRCATTLNQQNFQRRLNKLNDVVFNLPLSERNLWINHEIDWFDADFLNRTALITKHPTMGKRMFERSHREIVTAFETGRRFDSRWVLINGSLFLEGYYRNQRFFEHGQKDLPPIQSVLPTQPYFPFDTETQSYSYSRKNAHKDLFLFLKNQFSKGDKVTLYRGLNEAQAVFLQLIQLLNDSQFSTAKFETLRAELALEFNSHSKYKDWNQKLTALEQETNTTTQADRLKLQNKYISFFLSKNHWQESLFTTPSLQKATDYANPYVIEATLDMAELKRLTDEQQVYIGVEWEDLELLFYGPEALAFFANNASLRSTKGPK